MRTADKKAVFLSPPVLMHGGLLCITFRLSGRHWTKSQTRKKLISQRVYSNSKLDGTFSHHSKKISLSLYILVDSIGHCWFNGIKKGRWAHVNVKLHFEYSKVVTQF